jgi:hypothetical protein
MAVALTPWAYARVCVCVHEQPKPARLPSVPSSGALTPGVVVLSRVPHGFYEDAMRGFFSQFGTVTRLRLARNPKVRPPPCPRPPFPPCA